MTITHIHWPEYHHPKHASFHVKAEAESSSEPEHVWSCLIRAACWPTWSHSKTRVQILKGNGVELANGVIFRWQTTFSTYECTVVEFVPNKRLAWKGKCGNVNIYHAWLIEPLAGGGCRIISESTQRGGLSKLTRFFSPKRHQAYHQRWIEQLQKQQCGKG